MRNAFGRASQNGLLNRKNESTPLTEANCKQSTDQLPSEIFARLSGNDAIPFTSSALTELRQATLTG